MPGPEQDPTAVIAALEAERERLLDETDGYPSAEREAALTRLEAVNAELAAAKFGKTTSGAPPALEPARLAAPKLGLTAPALERVRKALGTLAALEPDEPLEPMSVEAMRDELALELTYAISAGGTYAALDALDLAKAIRDLAEAYVRLGGELAIPLNTAAPAPPRLNPADEQVVDRVRTITWKAVNAYATTSQADAAAAAVTAVLEELAR